MSKEKTENINTDQEENNQDVENQENLEQEVQEENLEENNVEEEEEQEEDEMEILKREVAEVKDKHLRLYSEFENYRRRTTKEKQELVKTSTEGLMVDLLPILDDFERARNAGEELEPEAVKEGYELIYQKFSKILEAKGLQPMKDKAGSEFDAEFHEAISQIPAPEKKLKGKIVDVVERGYTLGDKVVRFAKVVIGS